MAKLASMSILLALGGCSFALSRKGPRDITPVALDTALAVGTFAYGIYESEMTCPSSHSLCLNFDHSVGEIALGVALVFAASALYGHAHNPAPSDTRLRDLADHAAIAAHAGDCATAADTATQLDALDRNAYQRMVADEVVQSCLLRGSDAQRRAALDAIAHAPDAIPLAATPSVQP
jgi:hypothetical protein